MIYTAKNGIMKSPPTQPLNNVEVHNLYKICKKCLILTLNIVKVLGGGVELK